MLVSVEELSKTSLYPEIIQTITRNEPQSAELQILAAESLVKSYLSKYDTLALFGDQNTPVTFQSELLKKLIKIIASYYLVRLANPNVNIELYRADYQDALKWLEDLQSGLVNPDFPYKRDDPSTPDDESDPDVYWSSNFKRDNFF